MMKPRRTTLGAGKLPRSGAIRSLQLIDRYRKELNADAAGVRDRRIPGHGPACCLAGRFVGGSHVHSSVDGVPTRGDGVRVVVPGIAKQLRTARCRLVPVK